MDVRAVHDDGTFEGYLSRFNEVDAYGDIVHAGAFTRTLKEHRSGNRRPLLWQHDWTVPVGHLEAREDEVGLYIKGRLNLETVKGREAHALLKAGDIDGLSMGFKVADSEARGDHRHVLDVDLWEGSLVTFPAAGNARVHAIRAAAPPWWMEDAEDRGQEDHRGADADAPGLDAVVEEVRSVKGAAQQYLKSIRQE